MTPSPKHTPVSNFRIPIELKAQAKAIADERGESLTDVIIDALRRYIARHGRSPR